MATTAVVGNRQERGWQAAESATVAAVAAMNMAVVQLCEAVVGLLESEGWVGWGIRSPEHWVQWKAAVSTRRAEGIVAIARRRDDLPQCWDRFAEGRLSEDAMARIARVVPAHRDVELAQAGPLLTIPQLDRVLRCLPDGIVPERDPARGEPQRYLHTHRTADGCLAGRFCLPPDEAAQVELGLQAARDAEYRDRKDLPADADVEPRQACTVSNADALVRMAAAAVDGLDPHLARTGRPGDRHQLVIHRHVLADGSLSPARVHGSDTALPERLARYLICDAGITVALRQGARLIGFSATERTPNRRERRWIEQRDGGCVHPLCTRRRGLHVHHLRFWEDGGPTEPWNLVCLCPAHHRQLHQGEFTIEGNPEAGDLVVRDRWGRPIRPPTPPDGKPPPPLPEPRPVAYTPPLGERLTEWTWN